MSTLRGLNPPDNGELGDYYPDGSSLSAVPIGISSCLLEEELDFVELGFITVAHGQTSAHGPTLAHGQTIVHGQTLVHGQTMTMDRQWTMDRRCPMDRHWPMAKKRPLDKH